MDKWIINIDRDEVNQAAITAITPQDLPDGAVEMRIDEFALTANNITYAIFGKPSGLFGNDTGYWDFFSDRGTPGHLPIWGFATVTQSNNDGVNVGDVYYGYYPMASHVVLHPVKVNKGGFIDGLERRQALPPLYNQYRRLESLGDYQAEHHDYWPIFRPLYLTGWLIADQFIDDDDYGVEQIITASASSKTAIGFALATKARANRPKMIGLTSAGNAEWLRSLDAYDEVVSYDDIQNIDNGKKTAMVDMAGNMSLVSSAHHHFADNMIYSLVVGKSHWDSEQDAQFSPAAKLPGAPRVGFFAPARSMKRISDWGGEAFQQKLEADWTAFMKIAPSLCKIEKRQGAQAALDGYLGLLGDNVDPKIGVLITA
ncbi:hypothetical protein LPB140_02630 [Sphingorhabdus lutea]|uniref:DUF2855 family protein n=1 Tax=Sphingorhabdus lutea TaxID=1913578 RepID=A0A1L3J9T0_9SPHN|nr:DUF2855 family protein [Sphingorhabdus lutea]APG61902.1 hypothetical protein LPB140_02630 [Sphingorhabdus lutea]